MPYGNRKLRVPSLVFSISKTLAQAKMKAAVIKNYGDFDQICVETVPLPVCRKGEVLVQMKCAPMNVSDLMFSLGVYFPKPLPSQMGYEGSGVVVGGDDALLGKRVAVVPGGGTYAEYVVVKKRFVIVLNDDVSFEQAASLVVNPMTVAYMMHKIRTGHHPAVVINAAASALGKMLIRCCAREGIHTISLVRRQDQVDGLRTIGAAHVFNTSQKNWNQMAKQVCHSLRASCGFDAIAGKATAEMMSLLVPRGVVYNYGALSGRNPVAPLDEVMFHEKHIQGLYLFPWLVQLTPDELHQQGQFVQSLIGNELKTEYGREYSLDNIALAFRNYNEKKTDGKPLIRISN